MDINRYRLSLLIWVAVFPVVTTLSFAAAAAIPDAPLVLRSLILSAIMVPAMVFAIIPAIMRNFGEWLAEKNEDDNRDAAYERRLDAWFAEMAACPN